MLNEELYATIFTHKYHFPSAISPLTVGYRSINKSYTKIVSEKLKIGSRNATLKSLFNGQKVHIGSMKFIFNLSIDI